jgi:hypothetical protein
MNTEGNAMRRSAELLSHLERFPEDLRDIRRLQRRFALSAGEVARTLEAWHSGAGGRQPVAAGPTY